MTDEQFKELKDRLDRIERDIAEGKWRDLFKPVPNFAPAWPPVDHTGAPWPHMPRITD